VPGFPNRLRRKRQRNHLVSRSKPERPRPAQGACRHSFGDGTIGSETREAPRGSEHSFATEREIVEKFRKLTRHAMSGTRQAALVDAVLKLEILPDSKRLAELLPAA
jgi:hypothetical protein